VIQVHIHIHFQQQKDITRSHNTFNSTDTCTMSLLTCKIQVYATSYSMSPCFHAYRHRKRSTSFLAKLISYRTSGIRWTIDCFLPCKGILGEVADYDFAKEGIDASQKLQGDDHKGGTETQIEAVLCLLRSYCPFKNFKWLHPKSSSASLLNFIL